MDPDLRSAPDPYYVSKIRRNLRKAKNVPVGSGSVTNGPPGSGYVCQKYGSPDPDPKEIFTDLQH
jgi:hypothetical protein